MTRSTSYRPRVVLAAKECRRRSEVDGLLVAARYEVRVIENGQAAADAVDAGVEAVLLGLDLSAPSALDICRRLRRDGSQLPVAVLVVPGHGGAPARSLDAGADDHFDLSVDDDELLARVRALVRRSPSGCRVLQVGDLRLDRSSRLVTRGSQLIDLTLTEYTILELLLRNVDVVLERATIYEVIWGVDLHNSSKALDVHVGGLRRKLEQHGSRMIHTVRGVGYVMWAPAVRH